MGCALHNEGRQLMSSDCELAHSQDCLHAGAALIAARDNSSSADHAQLTARMTKDDKYKHALDEVAAGGSSSSQATSSAVARCARRATSCRCACLVCSLCSLRDTHKQTLKTNGMEHRAGAHRMHQPTANQLRPHQRPSAHAMPSEPLRASNSLIEVARPEVLVLHNDRHDPRLQLSHEGVAGNNGLNVCLTRLQVKALHPWAADM